MKRTNLEDHASRQIDYLLQRTLTKDTGELVYVSGVCMNAWGSIDVICLDVQETKEITKGKNKIKEKNKGNKIKTMFNKI